MRCQLIGSKYACGGGTCDEIAGSSCRTLVRRRCGNPRPSPLSLRFDHAGRWRRRGFRNSLGQTIALVGVEDCEALEERDGLRVFAGFCRTPALVVGNEVIGVDDGGAALTLPDIPAEAERLSERDPVLLEKPRSATAPHRMQDIDPGIATIGRRVLRHGKRRAGRRRSPRLDPRHAARFQLGNDLVGDFLIEPRPILTSRARVAILDIADLRDGRREPLSHLEPVTENQSALFLYLPSYRPVASSSTCHASAARPCVRDGSPKGDNPRSGVSAKPTARSRDADPLVLAGGPHYIDGVCNDYGQPIRWAEYCAMMQALELRIPTQQTELDVR